MPTDPVAAAASPASIRRLVVVNATASDQNFGLLVQPGSLDVVPDTGPMRILAWKVAFAPGRSASVTSRCHFEWVERHALMLGRLGRGSRYLAEAVLPVVTGSEAFRVGFVGAPHNGAAKLLQSDPGGEAPVALGTDGSFPPPPDCAGTTRHLALAAAVDPDDDMAGAAVSVPLGPNMTVTMSRQPRYRIVPLPAEAGRGSVVPPEAVAAAHVLDIDGRGSVTLVFTDRNVFEEATRHPEPA